MLNRSEAILRQAPLKKFFSHIYQSPFCLFVVVAFASILANVAAFELVEGVGYVSQLEHIALDTLLLIGLLFPIFVLFFFRPLVHQIKERKKSDVALEKREWEFRTLAENSPDLVIRFDRDLRYLYVNPAITALTGISADNFIGKTGRELVIPDNLTPVLEGKARQVFVAGKKLTFEFGADSPRGEVFMEASLVAEFVSDGAVDTVLAISRDITARRRGEDDIRSSRKRLRDLSAHLLKSREEERTMIAREIHDELGQVLATIQMQVSFLADEHLDKINLTAKISSLEHLLKDAFKTVQRVTSELRPHMLDMLGLAAATEWQIKEFERQTGIVCKSSILLLEGNFGKEVATALFRILQETLTNVIRHSGASHVNVRLEENENRLVMVISDNGKGITRDNIEDGRSFGIIGMRERAYALGGRVKFFGAPRKGTTVIVHIPLIQGKNRLPL